jgi:hypothetical protein
VSNEQQNTRSANLSIEFGQSDRKEEKEDPRDDKEDVVYLGQRPVPLQGRFDVSSTHHSSYPAIQKHQPPQAHVRFHSDPIYHPAYTFAQGP